MRALSPVGGAGAAREVCGTPRGALISIVLCSTGALDIGDSRVAFALCLGMCKLVNRGGRLG